MEALEKAGAAEVHRLHQVPLDTLVSNRHEQWWLWANLADQPRFGWSHIKWSPDELLADAERHFRLSDDRVVSIAEAFSGSEDWNRFDSNSTWTEVSEDEPGIRIRQQFKLRGDELSLIASSPTRTLAQWTEKASANFVAGALLGHLIPRLSATPMVLETDAFIGQELAAPLCPVAVIVRPQPGGTTRAATRPLRVVTVEINGTGELSRWHIAPDGRVESVDFAGDIQRQESSQREIKLEFAGDPAMLQP